MILNSNATAFLINHSNTQNSALLTNKKKTMNEETIGLELNDTKGYFYVSVDGKQEAKMTFVFAGKDKMIIDHTEVNPGNNGKGFGKKMVANAVEFAREKNITIVPLCPFAKSVFEKNPEFRDVL